MANTTHTDDRTYDLISVAYHALQGGDLYDQYIEDAQSRGDKNVADFFRETQQVNRTADRAKELIQRAWPGASRTTLERVAVRAALARP